MENSVKIKLVVISVDEKRKKYMEEQFKNLGLISDVRLDISSNIPSQIESLYLNDKEMINNIDLNDINNWKKIDINDKGSLYGEYINGKVVISIL